MFLLSQIGYVYMKLGSRNLRFWTFVKNLTPKINTPGRFSIREVMSFIIGVKG